MPIVDGLHGDLPAEIDTLPVSMSGRNILQRAWITIVRLHAFIDFYLDFTSYFCYPVNIITVGNLYIFLTVLSFYF